MVPGSAVSSTVESGAKPQQTNDLTYISAKKSN